jgi:hypothetical protein
MSGDKGPAWWDIWHVPDDLASLPGFYLKVALVSGGVFFWILIFVREVLGVRRF